MKYLKFLFLFFYFSFPLFSDNIEIMEYPEKTLGYPSSCSPKYGIADDYQNHIKAYVFPRECPGGNNTYYYPLPEEKRELQENDVIYRDEECIAVVLDQFPCYCYYEGKEWWIFEFESPPDQNNVTQKYDEYIIHFGGASYYSDWSVFGQWYGSGPPPNRCSLYELWGIWIKFYSARYIHCLKDKNIGIWKIRLIYKSDIPSEEVVLKEWSVELKNIDRGRVKLSLPDNPEYILPDGLEIETQTGGQACGDSANISLNFITCNGPKEAQTINFKQKFINRTGGHNHSEPEECDGTRQHPYCGYFSPSSVSTDKEGNASTTFTAPYYSGKIKIKAEAEYAEGNPAKDEREITVKVPDLVSFFPFYIWQIVPDNLSCIHGSENNYVNNEMQNDLVDLFVEWYIHPLNSDPKWLPRLTAGSLQWGGKFDDGVCWSDHSSGNHQWHRRGRDIDIGKSNMDLNKQRAFSRLIRQLYRERIINIIVHHSNENHWHLILDR